MPQSRGREALQSTQVVTPTCHPTNTEACVSHHICELSVSREMCGVLHRYMLSRSAALVTELNTAFENYQFSRFYQACLSPPATLHTYTQSYN